MLSNSTVWQVQGSNDGNANLNMPLLNDDVQVFGSMEMDPQISVNTPLGQIIIPKLFAQ